MLKKTIHPAGTVLMAALVVAACSSDGPGNPTAPDANFLITPGTGTLTIRVCKFAEDPATIGDFFTFNTSAPSGTVTSPVSVQAQDINTLDTSKCATVWSRAATSFDDETPVTVTEVVPTGVTLRSIRFIESDGDPVIPDITDPVSPSVTVVASHGLYIFFKNEGEGGVPAVGRMTGGGNQIVLGDVKVTRGFTIHCDITLSNNIEINWPHANNWHLDKPIETAVCLDDPTVEPAPPVAPFDTFIGTATGSLNGVPGSVLHFTFVDAGEPGGDVDFAKIEIWAPGANPAVDAPVLFVNQTLTRGNVQAHYDQPHGNKP